ncbi:MAG TPA: carbon-nitrogen hydrolase family protein [Capsulimonadaceae bacterium]|jgi:predicted amidohydrolase
MTNIAKKRNPLNIALLQLAANGLDVAANLSSGIAACRSAKSIGASIALFPEMWSAGYTFPSATDDAACDAWRSSAVSAESSFVNTFATLAAELDMAIAITYLETWPGAPRNTVTVIDRHGERRLTYAKVHTCAFGDEAALTPGDEFPVATVATPDGDVEIGCMICYDREFPESARVLMLNGAELILVPNACTFDPVRRAQLMTRAFENMTAVAMTNYPAPFCNGHSMAFDGMMTDCDDGPVRDMLIVEAGEAEGIYLASLDLDQLRAYRARETWGDAFRRPSTYAALGQSSVAKPFKRNFAGPR